MYKYLLCLRYLRSRYIALASVISVMLGVATMIVVNSVMSGFQSEMYKRLHGILSDVVVEAHSADGLPDHEIVMSEIENLLGDDLEGMTTTVHIPAMLGLRVRGEWITKQVNLIGIDEATYAQVGDFSSYLMNEKNRQELSFDLREDGYADRLGEVGWPYRRMRVAIESEQQRQMDFTSRPVPAEANGSAVDDLAAEDSSELHDESLSTEESPEQSEIALEDVLVSSEFDSLTPDLDVDEHQFDGAKEQWSGIVLGIAISNIRHRKADGEVADFFMCKPGDDIVATFATAGSKPQAVSANFTVVDFYESKMSEYDSTFAFVPLKKLQELRGMIDPVTGASAVSSIQLKLREGADLNAAKEKLRDRFPQELFPYRIQTWKEMQGPLLAAVQLETTILNILLFLIIAVAGFGILATFFMIVVEKTRDIGILKSLGASKTGIMSIFLSYGFSLGCVGSGVGMILGLLFVWNINRIAALLESITGREVFDPTIYYFQEIPTIVNPFTITWIAIGAMLIAVVASVLPALRAARMHPVEALRYE